jgi:hypothetical protein
MLSPSIQALAQEFDEALRLCRHPVFPAQGVRHAIALRASHGSAKVMFFAGPPLRVAT